MRMLLADNCGLTTLSQSLAPLQRLHTLALRHNQIKTLPSWLRHLSTCLETLLLDGNVFHGDHARLVRPLLAVGDTKAIGHPEVVHSPALSRLSRPNTAKIDEEPSHFPSPASFSSSPRTSFLERARSYRGGLRRPSVLSADSSPVNSLLLAEHSPRASTFTQRRLRSMRSTGDLNTPQPSIHSLISDSSVDLSDIEKETPSRSTPKKLGITLAEFFKDSQVDADALQAAETLRTHDSALDLSGDESEVPQSREARDQKPSFFRKLSMAAKERKAKMDRKRSMSVIGRETAHTASSSGPERKSSPGDAISQAKLGKGHPQAPFLTEDARSSSAPAAPQALSVLRSGQEKVAAASLTTLRPMKRSKLLRASPPLPWSAAPPSAAVTDRQERRSSLMLNMLPDVISPGPLSMGLSNSFLIRSIQEDDTVVITMPPCENKPAVPPVPEKTWQYDQVLQAQRREALMPIMAYLSDLDDLSEQDHLTSPLLVDSLQPRQASDKKASLSAVSAESSAQISSDDDSRQPTAAALPRSKKCKEDPIHREVSSTSFGSYQG